MNIQIYYGSQTGNSFELAQRIEFMFRLETKENVSLCPVGTFNFEKEPKSDDFFIFCVSTTGQGDPPDDSKSFWVKLMSNDLTFNFGSRFTFFAMGDSSYPKFNWVGLSMARRFEARFGNLAFCHLSNFTEPWNKELGGKLINDVVLCDERHELGYDFQADKGIQQLRSFMVENYNVIFEQQPFKVKHPVKISEGAETDSKPETVYISKVLETKRVTDEKHFQDTRLVRFEYAKGYKPGDVVNIHPVLGSTRSQKC